MASEMVRRVAMAISGSARPAAIARATRAITAMREPTRDMEQAFYAACDEHGHVLWRYGYRAIIDAALSETAPGAPQSREVKR